MGAQYTEKMTMGGRGVMGVGVRSKGEGTVYLSTRYFGNMYSGLHAA